MTGWDSRFLIGLFVLSILSVSPISYAQGLCDPVGRCLSTIDRGRYLEAERHMSAGNWQAAAEVLGELYAGALYSEEGENFLVTNNYAVALARSGRPEVAALVLERYFSGMADVGPSFDNLMGAYAQISALSEYGDQGTSPELVLPELGLIEPVSRLQQIAAPLAKDIPDDADTSSDAFARRVNEYLAAWSAGDVAQYLDFYVPSRSPDDKMDFRTWERQRRARVSPDRKISLAIRDLDVSAAPDGRVTTVFVQDYRSRSYSDTTRKRLTWVRIPAGWRIEKEATI